MITQKFVKIAGEMGVTPAQLAIAWCLRRPEVTSIILGASRLGQLEENIKAADVKISADVLERLDELFPQVADVPTV